VAPPPYLHWAWASLAALAIIDGTWLIATPLTLSASSNDFIGSVAVVAAVLLLAASRATDSPRISTPCTGGAFLVAAWPVLRLFNHLTMTLPIPFADQRLADWDAAIGFDWEAYLRWADSHPQLLRAMDYSYGSLTTYSAILFAALALGAKPERRCSEMLVLFLITAVMCSSIGALFPAEAAMAFYAPIEPFRHIASDAGTYHLESLTALRRDPAHVFDLAELPGLVTFPSFHTAMGLVAIYCARSTPWLFFPMLGINLVMIASTPIYGSHYAIDILAGAAAACTSIIAVRATTSVARIKTMRPVWAG
jgi:hypothetical protein